MWIKAFLIQCTTHTVLDVDQSIPDTTSLLVVPNSHTHTHTHTHTQILWALTQREVQALAKRHGGRLASCFNGSTSHVIVNTDENGLCSRTVKYLQGIATGRWIVSHECKLFMALLFNSDAKLIVSLITQNLMLLYRGHQQSRSW